jgi:beta-1,4-mannooligosaccharide/beta-1,4-mannosyl-N-acetylglucosamine phosphorylase
MSNVKIIGPAMPNIPWEERPAGCNDVLWRSPRNPIIPRDLIPTSNSIFNSAVVPFGKGFAGVFRCARARAVARSANQLHLQGARL